MCKKLIILCLSLFVGICIVYVLQLNGILKGVVLFTCGFIGSKIAHK